MATYKRNQPIQTRDAGKTVFEVTLDLDGGLCAQVDPELFFPDSLSTINKAKRICGQCHLKDPCLKFALEHDEHFGIWGGVTAAEREKMARGRKPRAPERY